MNRNALWCARRIFAHKRSEQSNASISQAGKSGNSRGDGRRGQRGCGTGESRQQARADEHHDTETTTPIQHVVVIFQENVSFDHYFATYPQATNPAGEPFFEAEPKTPTANGLSGALLIKNPNANNPANGANAINPFRLDRAQVSTCDQDHNYGHEQMAFDQGLMDLFPATVGVGENTFCAVPFAYGKDKGLVMGYFDGNTVTAMWNYAQNFAMNDNSYGTTFGPSTAGLLNLVAGNTYPATPTASSPKVVAVSSGVGTLVGDLDPTGDLCSAIGTTVRMGGQNIGDLLNAKSISWGSFMGGFDLTITNPSPGSGTGCKRESPATAANGGPTADYIPHHAFFQYWPAPRIRLMRVPTFLRANTAALQIRGLTMSMTSTTFSTRLLPTTSQP